MRQRASSVTSAPAASRRGHAGGGRLGRSTAVFAFWTGVSRVAGLAREIVAAALFGTGGPIAAFVIAFQVPNLLRSLVADSGDEGELKLTLQDLRAAVANLKAISQKINEGEGTVGALIADPAIYERLVTILDGAQRSFLLRSLIRGLGDKGAKSKDGDARR